MFQNFITSKNIDDPILPNRTKYKYEDFKNSFRIKCEDQTARPDSIDPVKKLDEFPLELFKHKKKTLDINTETIFEKNTRSSGLYLRPLTKL